MTPRFADILELLALLLVGAGIWWYIHPGLALAVVGVTILVLFRTAPRE
jgi:hypothetical protein